jgi:exodeoxyribonuclease III
MAKYKLVSWNVNGLRAILKKDFWQVVHEINPDVIGLQEIKADDSIMQTEILKHEKYTVNWHSCTLKKGYSGVATLSAVPVVESVQGFSLEKFDPEGRVIITKYQEFTLLNIYFPNGGQGPHRVEYKIEFYDACLEYMQKMRANGEKIIVCGDFNTAHHEIDLHDPKGNQKTSGFLPIERAWLDKLVAHNYMDTYRHFYPDQKDVYTWWDMRTRSRAINKGWRIDYFFIPNELKDNLKSAFVLPQFMGSDHCPLGIEIEF